MRRSRSLARGAALAVVLAVATGCADETGAGSGPDGGTSSSPVDRAGRVLTQEEAQSALPHMSDLPPEMSAAAGGPESDEGRSTYPASCLALMVDNQGSEEAASARASYDSRDGGLRGSAGLTLTSFDEQVPDTIFDSAGAALSGCESFELRDQTGTSSWEAEGLAFPNLGDRTFATRMRSTTEDDKDFKGGYVDVIRVKKGHNLIAISYAVGPRSSGVQGFTEKLVEITLTNLDTP